MKAMVPIRLNLLGPVQVNWEERDPPRFRSPATVGLLGYLVAEGRVLSRAALAAMFWPAQPESQARGELRRVLHNLSTILPGCIESTNQTVTFEAAERCQVDLHRFRVLGSHQDRLALQQAAGLYRAEFLEGLYLEEAPAFEAWLSAEREQWRLAAVDVLQRLAEVCATDGAWAGAAHAATRLLVLDPWREASHRLLMRVYARQGHWNAALNQYQTCTAVLARELGVPPAPETTSLYKRIVAARAQPRHNIPRQHTPFVGRQKELAAISQRLRDPGCGLVTVTGPGGMGKTRLARQVGLLLSDDFLNGVRFVSLGTAPSPHFLPTVLAAGLDMSLMPQPSVTEQIVAHLQQREMLLILDDFEHLPDGARLLAQILRDALDVKLLVTSRQRLNLREEWVVVLDGLPYPPPWTPTAQLPHYESVELFRQNAARAQDSFSLTEELAPVAHICRLLQGSPLGIELAAALTSQRASAKIAAEIERNMDVLQAAWRNAPPGHRSLRAVFDHSHRLLTAGQRSALQRLTVFRGGFTLEAARQVAEVGPRALAALQARSFVRQCEEEDETPRYELHATLQQYAAEELAAEPAEQREVERRYRAYFGALLAAQEGRFIGELAAVKSALLPDTDNLRAAWQQAVARRDWAVVDRMLASLHNLYEVQGWYQEGSELFLGALEAAQAAEAPGELRARLQVHAAGALMRLGSLPQAYSLIEEGLDILRATENEGVLAHALNTLGILHIYAGEFAAAAGALRQCIDLYRQSHEEARAVRPLANLGSLLGRQGDYDASLKILAEGLALCRKLGDRRGEALFLHNLGGVHLMRGDHAQAQTYLEASLPISEEAGHLQIKLVGLQNLAEIHLAAGRLQEALSAGEQSATLARELHDRPNLARSLKMQALAETSLGLLEPAWEHFREGLQIAYTTQALPALMDVLQGIVEWYSVQGRATEAARVAALIVAHPATEQQYRDKARMALQKLATKEGPAPQHEAPPSLEELVRGLLLLRYKE